VDRGSDRDHFVGVDGLAGVAAEQFLDHLLHRRHARHSTDEHHLVDVLRRELGVGEHGPTGADRAVHQIASQALELVALHRAL
jgi:hypothetical protein